MWRKTARTGLLSYVCRSAADRDAAEADAVERLVGDVPRALAQHHAQVRRALVRLL